MLVKAFCGIPKKETHKQDYKASQPKNLISFLSINITKELFWKKGRLTSWQTPMPIVASLQISEIAFQLFSLEPVPAEGLKN